MKIVRHYRPKDARYETDVRAREPDLPAPVSVDLELAAISPVDVAVFAGREPAARYPVVAGSAAVGVIRDTGDSENRRPRGRIIWLRDRMGGASGAKSGDRVLGLPHRACLTCPACAHGEYDACTSPRLAGVNADGYFGERFTSTERNLLSVPTVVSTRATLFAVDAAPIVRAFSQIDLEACTSVLIFGAGVPGILAALLTKRAGVTPILVDPIQPRLELARQLEVATVINPFAGHLGDDVLYATNGRLADAVIDTAGAATALAPLADAVATGATVVVTAAEAESHIPTRAVLQKELKVLGALPTRNDLRKALDAVEPLQSKLDDLVSTTVELSVVPETLAMAAASPESYLKLFVRPDA